MKAFKNVLTTFTNVEEHNKMFVRGESSYTLKVNDRADMDYETRNQILNGFRMTVEEEERMEEMMHQVEDRSHQELPPAPDSLDYRNDGCITEVLDQGEN